MRISKKSFSLLFFCLAVLHVPALSNADNELYWMEAVAPPFFIHDGPLKGQGYEDLITEILIENLPQYKHIRIQANLSRHYQQWKQGEPVCGLALYKTPEREELAYFSIPSVFTLPPVLIIKKERFSEFGGKKTISLEQLLKNGKFIVGRSSNRSYGEAFDAILNTYGNDQNLFKHEGAELSLNLFKMLLSERIDALPALPEEGLYLAEKLGFRDQIMTIAVNENINDHESMLTYVACSKTPWGKETIQTINNVLQEQRPTTRYRSAYERWLDKSSFEEYRKMYKNIFLEAK